MEYNMFSYLDLQRIHSELKRYSSKTITPRIRIQLDANISIWQTFLKNITGCKPEILEEYDATKSKLDLAFAIIEQSYSNGKRSKPRPILKLVNGAK